MRDYSESKRLYERAQSLIPRGIHLSGTPLLPPGQSPLYLVRGQGSRCWDIDGNSYIDYAMAFGPFLLGYLGIRPDLTTVSKALGNGWPVAAVVGSAKVLRAGAGMHYSATFHGETSALAAAMMVLEILDREPVAEQVWQRGERLIEGLNGSARRWGLPARAYGEPLPPMPFLKFEHPDPRINSELINRFYSLMLEQGILLHPRHMWFVSQAHSDADIDTTLTAAELAMERTSLWRGLEWKRKWRLTYDLR